MKIVPILTAALFALSGCEQVYQEFGEPGGFVGPQMDQVMVANAQRQRADRMALSFMVLAPVALNLATEADDARSTSTIVNTAYSSLADLYATVDCEGTRGVFCTDGSLTNGKIERDGYSFESAMYEVQSDFYFVGKSIIVNLDLTGDVEDLINLKPTSLVSIGRKMKSNFPTFRRLAANYRDGLVLYSHAVLNSCQSDCETLKQTFEAIYAGGDFDFGEQKRLEALLDAANDAAMDTSSWAFGRAEYLAIVAHIDDACALAVTRQATMETKDAEDIVNCGSSGKILDSIVIEESDERTSFVGRFPTE